MIMADNRVSARPFRPDGCEQRSRIDFEAIRGISSHVFGRLSGFDPAVFAEQKAACLDIARFGAMRENPALCGT